MGDNEPLGLFLGCKHEPIKVTLNDGHIATGVSYNSEAFLLDCVSLYKELYTGVYGHVPKLQDVDTPGIPEDVKNTCPASVPVAEGPALECPWCKFTSQMNNSLDATLHRR